mgnify:CR=1 FL=1
MLPYVIDWLEKARSCVSHNPALVSLYRKCIEIVGLLFYVLDIVVDCGVSTKNTFLL